jgi:glutamine cyclotransferase
MRTCLVFLLLALLAVPARAAENSGHVQIPPARVLNQTAIPVYDYKIIRTYPHDTNFYTEGLVMDHGTIYEGTGLYGHSKLLAWDLRTGRVLHEVSLDPHVFGEGVTVLKGTIYQLTYLANRVYTYDQKTFRPIGEFHYITQGWGLTTDGTHLIMGDGSSSIVFRDPKTFQVERRIFVTDNVGPVGFLNELEYVDGKIYANVWQMNFIAIIAPETGKVIGWINLTGLNPDPKKLIFPLVLNGIAYDKSTGHLLVTGKCWPHVYEIALVPRAKP